MSEEVAEEFETVKPYDPTLLGVKEDEPGTFRDSEGKILPRFDEKYKRDFEGLLYLGALSDEFEWLGHRFAIRTLRDGELLALSLIVKPYMDTVGMERAYAAAIVALCTMTVDDKELPVPIAETSRINEWAHQRFAYVRDNWYSYTIDEVYNRYIVLHDKTSKVVEAMGKASAPVTATNTLSGI